MTEAKQTEQDSSAAERLISNLKESDAFKNWSKDHSSGFCTHLFLQINSEYAATSHWDLGFYDPENKKVTVFTLNDAGKFEIKQTDDVFATKAKKIDELVLNTKTLDFPSIIPYAEKIIHTDFPQVKNLRGSGFTILQALEGTVMWNISFITKQLTFLNMKINAQTGEKISATNESAIMPEQK
jgi:hypothetical protein